MHVLVIYQNIPQDCQVFHFDMSEEEYEELKCVHNTYVNTSDLTEEQEAAHEKLTEQWIKAHRPVIDDTDSESKPYHPASPVDAVILTGFVL